MMLVNALLLAIALSIIERAQRQRIVGICRWGGWALGSLSLLGASAAGGWIGLMTWIGLVPVIAGTLLLKRANRPNVMGRR